MVLDTDLSDLVYHIVPAKRLGRCEYSHIHDQVFNFWVEKWTEAFSKAAPSEGWEDHFHKQDIVTAITHKGQVVAAHLYTFYNIYAASTQSSEYFSFIQEPTRKKMAADGFEDLMSMEYLCVDESVKRNSLKTSFGKVILGLGGYLAEEKGLDGAIGTPVKGNKVDIMMTNVGGVFVQENFKKYGFDVDLLLIPTKPCERSRDERAREVMEYLWNHRIDYTFQYHSQLAVAA